jgi:hypothetical protein
LLFILSKDRHDAERFLFLDQASQIVAKEHEENDGDSTQCDARGGSRALYSAGPAIGEPNAMTAT